MKKFLYVALMALVMGMFVGCKSAIGGSDYYRDHDLKIDYNNCTVNGTKYDNTTEKCWVWTLTQKKSGAEAKVDHYLWGTQFALVAACETVMYESYKASIVASYAFIEAPAYKNEKDCDNNNGVL